MKKCCKQKTKWKHIPGFPSYYKVSNKGEVKSLDHTTVGKTGRTQFCLGQTVSSYRIDKWGHYAVNLRTTKGKQNVYKVHRLVLLAFIGPCPKGLQCRHLDGNGSHNCPSNLRWGTPQENSDDKKRHGTMACGEKSGGWKLTNKEVYTILTRLDEGGLATRLAKQYEVNISLIHAICKGKTRKKVFAKWVKAHGRTPNRAIKHCTLTDHEVYAIITKRDAGETSKSLANQYKVNTGLINRIYRGDMKEWVYAQWIEDHGRVPHKVNDSCKLTPKEVYTIITKVDAGEPAVSLTTSYGVSDDFINAIFRGEQREQVYAKWVKDHGRAPRRTLGNRKLTNKEVYGILTKVDAGETPRSLMEHYKLSHDLVRCICKGKARKRVYKKWVKVHGRAPHVVDAKCKLTPKEVYTILTKRDVGTSSAVLAEYYEVGSGLIRRICAGKLHVPVYNQWIEDHERIPTTPNTRSSYNHV